MHEVWPSHQTLVQRSAEPRVRFEAQGVCQRPPHSPPCRPSGAHNIPAQHRAGVWNCAQPVVHEIIVGSGSPETTYDELLEAHRRDLREAMKRQRTFCCGAIGAGTCDPASPQHQPLLTYPHCGGPPSSRGTHDFINTGDKSLGPRENAGFVATNAFRVSCVSGLTRSYLRFNHEARGGEPVRPAEPAESAIFARANPQYVPSLIRIIMKTRSTY